MSDAKENPSFSKALLAKLNHTPRTVLDLSPSLQTIELAKRLPQSLVVGLIFSRSSTESISAYSDRLGKGRVDNVNFMDGSPDNLPFEDGTFDMVILKAKSTDFLGRKEISGRVLREMHRVLSMKGQAFVNLVLTDSPSRLAGKRVSNIHAETDKMVALVNKMPFKSGVIIERKELNLEIAFRRIK